VRAFGDFHQIVGFINRIERYERYLKISDLIINEQKQGVSEAQFKLSTYRFLQKTEAETPQQPGAASQGRGEAS
jgi:Tfp pilus assembly protein PilO